MKPQRNALGKLFRTLRGKIISAVRCCCGQPPIEGCNRELYHEGCLADDAVPNIPSHAKIVVTGTSTCSECVQVGDFYVKVVGGSIDRTYFMPMMGAAPGTLFSNPSANFFTAKNTPVAGAIDVKYYTDAACTVEHTLSRAEAITIGGSFSGTPGTPGSQQFFLGISPLEFGAILFFNSAVFGTSDDLDVVNFCNGTANIVNSTTQCGDPAIAVAGGSAEITTCPPCAVVCDLTACVAITTSGESSVATEVIDPDGEFVYQGKTVYSEIYPPGIETGYGPAGCVWIYRRALPDGDYYTLYPWFDGQDYRAILTKTVNGIEQGFFASYEAGDIECVDDVLTGTMTLKSVDRTRIATVTIGACGVCDDENPDCDDDYRFTLGGPGTSTSNFAGGGFPQNSGGIVRVDDVTHWGNELGDGPEIYCDTIDGTDYWILRWGAGGTVMYRWRAPRTGNPCPPTTPGAWVGYSVTGDTGYPEITAVSSS